MIKVLINILKDIGLQRFCYDLMNFKGVRCMVNSPYIYL